MTYTNLITRILATSSGTEFIIKDLFTGLEWNNIPVANRRSWGTRLLSEVQDGVYLKDIAALNKTSANAQRYRRL
ncbi:DUF1413 domain-containing protein [Latilactobacillus sakei]|uniref:DUF1413 domain-containing protein n=1 Tax=Latilactobacillus sakei TaxID=1599 RepID=UPI00338EFC2D